MATEKCTRLPALTVERNVKFHSNLTAAGQCIVENATANEDHHEDIKLTYYFRDIIFFLFLALRKQIKRKKKMEFASLERISRPFDCLALKSIRVNTD